MCTCQQHQVAGLPGNHGDALIADALARKKRQRMGGNKKKKFTEGWVEFLNKRDAKLVARTLNNQPVGMVAYVVDAVQPWQRTAR